MTVIRKLLTPTNGLFLVLLVGLQVVGQSKLLRDPGTYWHTIVGNKILDAGMVFRTDPFSFTKAGEEWFPTQWLSECGMAVVHRAGGLDLLLFTTSVLLAWLYAWLGYRFLATSCHPILAVLFVLMTMAASSYHFHVRPHILSIALLGVAYGLLLDVEERRRPLASLGWLVPLFVLWTNLHAGVLGGIGTVGLTFAGWSALWLFGRDGPVRTAPGFLLLAVVGGLLLLSLLVNPFGTELVQVWLHLSSSPLLPLIIEEHAPLSLRNDEHVGILTAMIVYLVVLASVPARSWRVSWFIPLVWLYLGTTRIRHAPLFAITSALALAEMLPYNRGVQWLLARGSTLVVPIEVAEQQRWSSSRDWPSLLLPISFVLTAILLILSGVRAPLIGTGWATPDPSNTPLPLLEPLRERMPGPGEAPKPLFNDLNFGGFVIYYLPGYRVFIDDRCEFYQDEGLRRYIRARGSQPERIEEWAEEYGFTEALVERGKGFDRYLESAPGWRRLAETPYARVYERKQSEL